MLVSDREYLVMKGIAPVRYTLRTVPTLPYSHRAHKGLGVMDYNQLLAQAGLQNCSPTDVTCVANNTAIQAAVEDYWAANQATGVPDGTVISIPPLTPAQVQGPTGFYDPTYQGGNIVAALPVTVTSPNTPPVTVVQGIPQATPQAAAAATAAAQALQVTIQQQGVYRDTNTGQLVSLSGQPIPAQAATGYYTTPPPAAPVQPPPASPPPPTTPAFPVSMAFLTSSGTSQMHVGDTWTVHVTGAPGDVVKVTGGKDGQTGTVTEGTIDATGNFVLSGAVGDGDVGNWDETWYSGATPAGEVVFTVAPAGFAQTPSTPPATTPSTNTIPSLITPSGTPISTTAGTTVLATSPTGIDTLPNATGTFMGDVILGASALFHPSEWGSVFSTGTAGEIAGLVGIPVIVVAFYMMSKKGRR